MNETLITINLILLAMILFAFVIIMFTDIHNDRKKDLEVDNYIVCHNCGTKIRQCTDRCFKCGEWL